MAPSPSLFCSPPSAVTSLSSMSRANLADQPCIQIPDRRLTSAFAAQLSGILESVYWARHSQMGSSIGACFSTSLSHHPLRFAGARLLTALKHISKHLHVFRSTLKPRIMYMQHYIHQRISQSVSLLEQFAAVRASLRQSAFSPPPGRRVIADCLAPLQAPTYQGTARRLPGRLLCSSSAPSLAFPENSFRSLL
jgi:hypothetical protein